MHTKNGSQCEPKHVSRDNQEIYFESAFLSKINTPMAFCAKDAVIIVQTHLSVSKKFIS